MFLIEQPYKNYTGRDGKPLDNGYVYIGTANANPITSPVPVYWDAAGTQPALQPLRTMNGYIVRAGTPANVFVNTSYSIMIKDSRGRQVFYARNSDDFSVIATIIAFIATLASFLGSSLIGFIQAGVGAVLRTLQSKARERVSVLDYGAVGDGVTDDRPAFLAGVTYLATRGGGILLVPKTSTSYLLSTTVEIPSNVTVEGEGNPTITRGFADGFVFLMSSVTFAKVQNLRIVGTIPSTTSPGGAVGLQSSTYCTVENVEIVGMRQHGIWLYDSSFNTIRCNRMRDWIGAYFQDSADISVLNNSNYNLVTGNKCYGGGDHGISVQDTYAGAQPTGNRIVNNIIGAHTAYGILVYVTNNFDTQTLVDGNMVRDIIGSSLGGASGAGIYIQSAGGTIVTNNTVTNCCISTSNFFTLAPACIGVTTPPGTPSWPIIVSNNSLNSVRGPCVAVISTGGPVTVKNNVTTLNCADTAANPISIYVSNAPRTSVTENTVNHTSPSQAIYALSRSGITFNDLEISNNSVEASVLGISVTRLDTAVFESVRINENYVKGAPTNAMIVKNATGVTMSGNILNSLGVVLEVQFCPGTMVANNAFYGPAGSNGVIFANGCTGSVFAENNVLTTRMENNAASGVIVCRYGSATPAVGSWNVGDRIIQSVPAVGQPKGWRCTVAGAPGTWVSEGNL